MNRSIVFAAIALGACTTNEAGKQVVDVEAVKTAALLTCAVAPTAAQIAQMYTDNKNVKTTKDAVALICAAVLPIITAPVPEVKK